MSDSAGASFFAEALARARARRAAGNLAAAWRELREGLEGEQDYASAVAAARFLENTALDAPPSGWPARRVALIGSDTLTFLRPVLRALAFRDGWWPVFYEAPFGAWRQEILAPQSALRAFQPEVTLILRGWQAAGLEKGKPVDDAVERLVGEELALAQCAAAGLGMVLWPGYDFPPGESSGSSSPDSRGGILAEINRHLRAGLPHGLIWVDLAEVQASVGESWADERWWEAARQHPSAEGSVALIEGWLALLRARWGRMRKVLVTDLDNVLWGGIVGEDGVENLRVGPGTPEGAAHAAYQKYLLELKNRGVLLAVCSKNNESDVTEVFARRAMPLKREDFAAWAVNWEDKSANLRAIAAKLRLGLDSFVFVDDQPAERARVRQALPEVAVPEMPLEPVRYVASLRKRRFFETLTLTAEDRLRAGAYAANEQRAVLQTAAASLEDFLRGLEMTAEHGPMTESVFDRIEQLLARTNQWNLTTRRHDRAEIAALAARPGAPARWFRLRDRFGDHGLVGVWIALPRAPGEWEIDSWVMSCRVIGRGLEDLMFNTLVETARAAGARRLRGIFRPTAKNALASGFLPGVGFVAGETLPEGGGQSYVLDLARASLRPHCIRVAAQAPAGGNLA